MAAIGKLRVLESLLLDGALLEDEWLAELDSLPLIKQLSLCDTPIHGQGLPPLRKLWKLRSLQLAGCPLDDSAIEHLCRLKQLDKLDLSRTYVTDPGIAGLQKISSLRHLELARPPLPPPRCRPCRRPSQPAS